MNQDIRRLGYQEIAEEWRARIRAGELTAGDALPSEPALSARYGVNRATVRRALAALRDDDLIETHPKSGSTVAPIAPADQVPAPAEVALLLEVEVGAPVARRRRMRWRNGKVVPESVTYIRLQVA